MTIATAILAADADNSLTYLLFGAGVACLVFAYVRHNRRHARRGDEEFPWLRAGSSAARAPAGVAQAPPAGPESNAETEDLLRRLAREVDAKAERLEHLIARADDRLRRLESTVEAPGPAAGAGEARLPRLVRPPLPVPGPAPSPPTDPITLRIYSLADQGLAPVEIARTLDQPTGKVELVLALRSA